MVSTIESEAIEALFNLFDSERSGIIPRHRALKIINKMGIPGTDLKIPSEITFAELLGTIEYILEKKSNSELFESQLDTFQMLLDVDYKKINGFIDPDDLYTLISAGGASRADAKDLLVSLMPWEESFSETRPMVHFSAFSEEVTRFHKANRHKKYRRVSTNAL